MHENEAEESARLRSLGLRYARDHAGRLPVVLGARLGRSFELFRPRQNAHMEAFYEGRNLTLAQLGTLCFYLLAGLGASAPSCCAAAAARGRCSPRRSRSSRSRR